MTLQNCQLTCKRKLLLRNFTLLICLFTLQTGFSQELVLKTATDTLSLAQIASCKENNCLTHSVKLVTNAIQNARLQAAEILSGRTEIEENIIHFNHEVELFYHSVDSLGELYRQNNQEMDDYKQEQANFAEKYQFVNSSGLNSAIPQANVQNGLISRASQASSSGSLSTNNGRVQKDIDDKVLKEKGRRLNAEHQHILDMKGVFEKKRLRLMAEGNYLNTAFLKNTDSLQASNNRMMDVVNFGKTANKILTDLLHSPQIVDETLLMNCDTLTVSLNARVKEAKAMIVNLVQVK